MDPEDIRKEVNKQTNKLRWSLTNNWLAMIPLTQKKHQGLSSTLCDVTKSRRPKLSIRQRLCCKGDPANEENKQYIYFVELESWNTIVVDIQQKTNFAGWKKLHAINHSQTCITVPHKKWKNTLCLARFVGVAFVLLRQRFCPTLHWNRTFRISRRKWRVKTFAERAASRLGRC